MAASASPALLLANELGPQVNPANYLVSEKYDGVRAIWDGKTLHFRSGRAVNAPAWFIAQLPVQALDGELWLARGRFETLSGIVRKSDPQDGEWRQLKYMIFELPNAPGTFFDSNDSGKGELAAARVLASLLTHRTCISPQIEEVVDNLKGQPQPLSIRIQGGNLF